MKDIYDLLNDVNIDMDHIDKIELTKKEKEKIVKNMKLHKTNRFFRNFSKLVIAAAVILMAGAALFNDTVNALAMETVANIIELFQGNSKNDYAEEINTVVSTDGFQLDLEKAEREDGEIRVDYTLTFDDDISYLKTIGQDVGYKVTSVYYTDAFSGCNIYIDGREIDEIYNSYTKDTELFYYYDVNDVSITEHELKQELVLYLNDKDYNKDVNIKLDFNNLFIGGKVLTGPVTAEYDLVAGKYTNEIDKNTLEIDTVSLNGTGFNITGFAYTNTGLKIYADFVAGPEGPDSFPIVYFKAVDNFGNKYLYYPIYDINDQTKMTFYIYDGPADEYKEYLDYLAEGVTSMTLTLYEELYDFDTNVRSENRLCEDFTIELKEEVE